MLTYDDLIARYTQWATSTPDIRAVIILGSRARTDHPADEWADLDLLVFTNNLSQFIQSEGWAVAIAPTYLSFVEPTGDGKSLERRTLYQGGLDVDVAFNPVEILDALQNGIPPDVADVLRRGVKVLVDKDNRLAQIMGVQLPETAPFQKPSQQEFINSISDFWYHTLWSAKHLRRGELWWAKSGVDMHLKELLRKMLEWQAHATKGENVDTWLRGRFLEEWADARALEQLCLSFARYDRKEIAGALLVTMDIYRWLEDETAACWGYQCPVEGEHKAAELTKEMLEAIR